MIEIGLQSTVLSADRKYRYRLFRDLSDLARPVDPPAVFVMLNPSTADASEDDPTVRRCMDFASAWGCGSLFIVNLFAVRGPDPRIIRACDDPVGADNHDHVTRVAEYAHVHGGPVVCAWGANGAYMDQDRTVLGWLESALAQPMCLQTTAEGHPGHPLYLPKHLKPRPFTTGRAA